MNGDFSTRTLIGRLREPGDNAAQAEFDRRYRLAIYGWCRSKNLQHADAEDLAQEVFTKVLGRFRIEQFDPSVGRFRNWLRTIVRNAIIDAWNTKQREPGFGTGDSNIMQLLNSVESPESSLGELETLFDQDILDEAMKRVRLRVHPDTWTIFEMRSLENLPAKEVAEEIGKTPEAVDMANHRVHAMIRSEVELLECPSE